MAGQRLSIAIIGGGIGGLNAALTLLRAGFDVQVYEQSPELTEAGAGLVVSPNASRLLIALGLGDEMARVGVKPTGSHQRRWQDGRTLGRSRFAGETETLYSAPHYLFHRGDMHRALARAFPAERVHLAHRCVAAVERGDRVVVHFENGSTASADVLIGADGVHSTIRTLMLGSEKPRFTGCIAYRGLIPAERVAHLDIENAQTNWMGPGRHFVHYFVAAGRMLNFVGLLEQDEWVEESWTQPGEVADLDAAYAGFAPQVRGIIAAADHTFKWALLDRVPLPRWSFGRITLLGDACHPMLPFLGQGAAQAIEDGATLAACLKAQSGDVAAALERYQALRLPRASRCQEISRNNMIRYHLPDGPEQQERDAKMAAGATGWSADAIGWLYGHDASVLPAETQVVKRRAMGMAPKDVSIAIIGGGIGGLTAAVCLLQAGFDVRVYEQARWLAEVGAGINISPNASRILIRLGLGEECAKVAFRSPHFHQRRWQDGRTLTRIPLGDEIEAEFGAPHMIFHRGELHSLLARAIPPERAHLAHRCVDVRQDGDKVIATFDNGVAAKADVLIAADGIHSTVRRILRGPEKPRFANRAYRGLIPAEKVADIPRESTAWLGPRGHFIHYFVSAGRMLNFVGHKEQDTEWLSESWTEPGKVSDLRAAYAGWHPQVQRIIDAVDETFIWAVLDREPIDRWTYGRITMLGDACQPMLPYMGQGGAQAIEDAAAITTCLLRHTDDPEAALGLYQAVRLPRASKIQDGSWENKTRFHMPDGPAQVQRDAEMAKGMTDWSYRSIAWVYGHDAYDLPTAA